MYANDNIVFIKKINEVLDELDIPLANKRKLKKQIQLRLKFDEEELLQEYKYNTAKNKLLQNCDEILKIIKKLYMKVDKICVIDYYNDIIKMINNTFSYENIIRLKNSNTKEEKNILDLYMLIVKNDIDIIDLLIVQKKYSYNSFFRYLNIINNRLFPTTSKENKYVDENVMERLDDAIKGVE